MSAFNDFCIVCDQICQSNSVYCSDNCKLIDMESSSHYDYTNTSTLEYNYQYQSPLLTSSAHSNFDLDSDSLNLAYSSSFHDKDHHHSNKLYFTDYLSTTSINYKKWLLSTSATITN